MKSLALLLAFLMSGTPASILRSPKQILDRTLLSTFRLSHSMGVDPETGHPKSYVCTGWIQNAAKGWGITAAHCIPDDTDSQPLLVNDRIEVEVVKVDKEKDLAVIKIPVMMGPPIEFAKDVNVLDEVVAIGYGYGKMKAEMRHVAGFDGDNVFFDNELAPGMSGGPIVNMQGELVGVVDATADAVGVGIDLDALRDFLKHVK